MPHVSTEPLPVVVRRGAGRTSECGEALPIRPAPAGRAIGLDLSALDFADPFFLLRLRGFLDFPGRPGMYPGAPCANRAAPTLSSKVES